MPWAMADAAVAQGLLQPVMQAWCPPPVDVHAVYPSSRYLTPKMRAFIELAQARFSQGEASGGT